MPKRGRAAQPPGGRSTTMPSLAAETHTATQLLAHVLTPMQPSNVVPLYHNRALQPLAGVSVEYLFARFAWALFAPQTFPLLGAPGPHTVLVFEQDAENASTQRLTCQQIRDLPPPFPQSTSKSRSASPKKRQRPTNPPDDSLEGIISQWDSVTAASYEQDGCLGERGRRRRRRGSSSPPLPSLTHSTTRTERSSPGNSCLSRPAREPKADPKPTITGIKEPNTPHTC